MSILEDLAEDLVKAEGALTIVRESMDSFHASCNAGRWDETEGARQRATDALDAYFDAYAASHRRMNADP